MAGGDSALDNTRRSLQLALPVSGRYAFRCAAIDALAAAGRGCTNKQSGIFDKGALASGAIRSSSAD
jgi:hypothetical protein